MMDTSTDRTEGSMARRDTGLVWGLKESFLDYVAGCPDGSVELSPGTGQLPDGRFYFSPDPSAPPAALHFCGGVRLRAYGGMLDVCLMDPRVEESAGGAALSAETWKEGLWQRIRFADLTWAPALPGQGTETAADATVRTMAAGTRLHPDATALFDYTYAAGEVLSPLVLRTLQEGAVR